MSIPADRQTTSPVSQSQSAKPFLKWAGGKQQLLAQFESYFPAKMDRYVEPFLGGGAVFFHLSNAGRLPRRIYLSDYNAELVNTYLVVRDKLDELIDRLAVHQRKHNRDYYYKMRGLDRQSGRRSDVELAARTVYLNKTCYNGLYRVNQYGQFNVPMGSYKNPRALQEDTLRAASAALQGVCLETRDFRTIVDPAVAGDFFYFDPPYAPLSKTSSFTGYTAGNFRDEDQASLADVYAQLSDKGCRCMLSNSYTPFILDLYRRFRIETVRASRVINSDANGRGAVQEVVVLNY